MPRARNQYIQEMKERFEPLDRKMMKSSAPAEETITLVDEQQNTATDLEAMEEEDDPTSPVPKGSSSRKSTIERKVSYDPPQSPEKEAGSTLKRSPKSAKGTDDLDDKLGTATATRASPRVRPLSSVFDDVELSERTMSRYNDNNKWWLFPNAKTSLFIGCSGLYCLILVVGCLVFLTSEIVTHHVPLHYFEGLFTYMYIVSILFLLYVFCFLLHEYSCCGGPPQGTSGRNTYFQNLPRDALPDGSPIREKLATFKRPKKLKTSENDFSHGSFFLRIGGIAFGLGTMIYNGLELGTFFEIPWDSPCYQVLRGINPILQMIFTFSQMYFVFMNARLNIHKFKFLARFGLMHMVATNLCVWMRTLCKESIKEIALYRVDRGQGVSEDYMILQGYNILRRKFGEDSFWVNGPYHAIMKAITGATGPIEDYSGKLTGGYRGGMMSQRNALGYPIQLADNFTCGRNYIMGDIFKYSGPYLYPFVIEYSLITAAVIYAMWTNIGKNPRYWGEDDDRMSVASRKMTAYAKTDCIGASKGLFFGLLTLVSGLICLILFFVLIDHENRQIAQLAVYLADSSHCVILIVSILATFLGFIRVQKMKFHGEDQSILGDLLLRFSSLGIFAYSVFNIVAGGLGPHTDIKNLLVFATGAITIIQVVLQLLFITDAQRRRIHSANHENSKPGRQVVTFLLICNLTMWVIYTFEVQKVQDSPIQLGFFGYYAWSIIQRVTLPLCIFFRFHSSVILVEIWKNTYKTKLMD